MTEQPTRIILPGAAARACNVSYQTVQRWVDGGLIPGAYRLPGPRGRRIIPVECLRRFLDSHGMPTAGLDSAPRPGVVHCNDAARACSVTMETIYTWIDKGLIAGAYRQPGPRSRRMIPLDGLLAFMRQQGMPTTEFEDST